MPEACIWRLDKQISKRLETGHLDLIYLAVPLVRNRDFTQVDLSTKHTRHFWEVPKICVYLRYTAKVAGDFHESRL